MAGMYVMWNIPCVRRLKAVRVMPPHAERVDIVTGRRRDGEERGPLSTGSPWIFKS